jgi:hypothetical protein
MSDDNPYSPPQVADLQPPQRRRPFGPILAGSVAIVLVTLLVGPLGFVAAFLGVGSWWVYKFWPRQPISVDPETQSFLERLESSPAMARETLGADVRVAAQQPEADELLRDIRL